MHPVRVSSHRGKSIRKVSTNPLVRASGDRMRYWHKVQLIQQMRTSDQGLRRNLCACYGCFDGCSHIRAEYCDGLFHIHCAVARGKQDIISQLISEGHDVNNRNENADTPLILAAVSGDTHILDMLLKAGADMNAADRNGVTALMTAVMGDHYDAVKLLLDSGAEVNAESTHTGYNAMALAILHASQPIVQILKAAGGRTAHGLPWYVEHGRDDSSCLLSPINSPRRRMLRDAQLELSSADRDCGAVLLDIASLERDLAALTVESPPGSGTTTSTPALASVTAPTPAVTVAEEGAIEASATKVCAVGDAAPVRDDEDSAKCAVSVADEWEIVSPALSEGDVDSILDALARVGLVTESEHREAESRERQGGESRPGFAPQTLIRCVVQEEDEDTEGRVWVAAAGGFDVTVRETAVVRKEGRNARKGSKNEGGDGNVEHTQAADMRTGAVASQEVDVGAEVELVVGIGAGEEVGVKVKVDADEEAGVQTRLANTSEGDNSGLSSDEDIVFVSDDDNHDDNCDDSDREDNGHHSSPVTTNIAHSDYSSGCASSAVATPSRSAVSLDAALLMAVEHGSLTQMRLLLDNKASPHARNALRQDALMLALARGHMHVWQHLLQMPTYTSACACDRAGKDVLVYALERGALDVVRHVLDSLAISEQRTRRIDAALIAAAALGNARAVQVLLDAGASVVAVNACGETANLAGACFRIT